MRMFPAMPLLILVGALPCLSADAPPEQPPAPLLAPTEEWSAAFLDLATVPPADRPFVRYIPIPSGSAEDLKAASLTLNYVSRASTIKKPDAIVAERAGKKTLLARFDLRWYWPKADDLKEVLALWEELQFDPRYSLLITKDTLKLIGDTTALPKARKRITKTTRVKVGTRRVEKQVEPYVHTDGKVYNGRWVDEDVFAERLVPGFVEVAVADVADVDVVRLRSPVIDPRAAAALEDGTGSQAPLVSVDYLASRLLSAIKDKGLYKVLYGGLYYDFAGIKTSDDKDVTDEDLFLESLGIGKKGERAKALFDRLNSDQRLAVFKSRVTGKPRRIDLFRSPAGSRDGGGFVSFTHDLKDEDVDIGTHPIFNLIDFKDAAREVIYERANGLQGYVLFNGEGKRQDEAPPDVVIDSTIPDGHTKRLQSAISCIRCHGKETGWQPLANDVKALLSGKLDVFADLSDKKKLTQDEVLDRLQAYGGNFDKWLTNARDDYSQFMLRATGPWKLGAPDQTAVVKVASAHMSDVWAGRWYQTVDAARALRELGVPGEKGKEQAMLRRLLPPDLQGVAFGIIAEDPRAAALKEGVSIRPQDFDLAFGFIAARVQQALADQAAPKKD